MGREIENDALVLVNHFESEKLDIFRLELNVPEEWIKMAQPGMYCAFSPKDATHTQRRPFSIVEAYDSKLVFLIKRVGPNTEYFTRIKKFQHVRVTEPRGKMIKIDKDADHYILIGGGVGGAGLVFPAKRLKEMGKKVTVLLGGKDVSQLVGSKYFNDYKCEYLSIIENAPPQNAGLVTDLFDTIIGAYRKTKAQVIACGPIPMLVAVAKRCREIAWPCQVILEGMFACNMGACLGCAVFMEDGSTQLICKDGPSFWAHKLDLEILSEAHPTSKKRKRIKTCNLSVDLVGQSGRKLELEYPTIGAAGCQSAGAIASGMLNGEYLGAVNAKGPSLKPSTGNLIPRVCETPSGMLNRISLENPGLDEFLKVDLKKYLALGMPVIVNIHGKTIEEYVAVAKGFNGKPIAALEINISCPNVEHGGILFGVDSSLTYKLVNQVRRNSDKPIIVKLTPNVTNIVQIAQAAVKAGADAISLINAPKGMVIDIETRYPKIRGPVAGLSGPAIRPIGIFLTLELHEAKLGVPLICTGGIDSWEAAVEYFVAGASAIQVGTAGFINKDIFSDIVQGLESYMLRKGFANLSELTGSVKSYDKV